MSPEATLLSHFEYFLILSIEAVGVGSSSFAVFEEWIMKGSVTLVMKTSGRGRLPGLEYAVVFLDPHGYLCKKRGNHGLILIPFLFRTMIRH